MISSPLRTLFIGLFAFAIVLGGVSTFGTAKAGAVSLHKPNLVITSIVTKPNRAGAPACVAGSGIVSGPATMFVTIKNSDPIATAGSTSLEFQGLSLTANLGLSAAVPSINGGGQVTIQLALPDCQIRGWAFVDGGNLVAESNELDNRFDIVMF